MAANSLSYQFKMAPITVKIIAINLVIFLLVPLIAFLFKLNAESLVSWAVLPAELDALIKQPWSLLTYSFLHGDFWHIFFNMILLYWFGNIILNLFNAKRFTTIYLLGAMAGGALYVLAYNLFPVFSNASGNLRGASAAVLAILVFIAAYAPNTQVRIFMFNIKVWHIAVVMVVKDIIFLSDDGGNNAGGLVAHLGGALFGYVYARQLVKGNDIGRWFENGMDWFVNLFKTRTKKPFKKVHRTTRPSSQRSKQSPSKDEHQKKIDSILDKIGKSGYESLTKAEKDFLFKAGKED